jgi:hypothetical protein
LEGEDFDGGNNWKIKKAQNQDKQVNKQQL